MGVWWLWDSFGIAWHRLLRVSARKGSWLDEALHAAGYSSLQRGRFGVAAAGLRDAGGRQRIAGSSWARKPAPPHPGAPGDADDRGHRRLQANSLVDTWWSG